MNLDNLQPNTETEHVSQETPEEHEITQEKSTTGKSGGFLKKAALFLGLSLSAASGYAGTNIEGGDGGLHGRRLELSMHSSWMDKVQRAFGAEYDASVNQSEHVDVNRLISTANTYVKDVLVNIDAHLVDHNFEVLHLQKGTKYDDMLELIDKVGHAIDLMVAAQKKCSPEEVQHMKASVAAMAKILHRLEQIKAHFATFEAMNQ